MNTEPSPTPVRQLRRASNDKTIGGVCAGIANYLAVDPVIVRIVWLVAAFAGGVGFLAYVVAWMVMPSDDGQPVATTAGATLGVDSPENRKYLGIGLVVVAIILALDGDLFLGDVLWPVVLIGGGAWLLFRDNDRPADQGGASGTRSSPPPAPATTVIDPDADDEVDRLVAAAAAYERGDHLAPPTPPEAAARADRGPRLTAPAVGLLVCAGAAMVMIDRSGIVAISARTGLSLLLAGLGVLMLIGARFGRIRGLIAIGAVLVGMLTVVSLADVDFGSGFGERRFAPATANELEGRYRLAAGELVLDLRGLDDLEGTHRLEASVGFGSLRVLIDRDIAVDGVADLGAGELTLPDEAADDPTQDDFGIEQRFAIGSAVAGSHVLELDLHVGFGEIVVEVDDAPSTSATARELPERTDR